jgi:uncharacterized protein (DUF1684 family)
VADRLDPADILDSHRELWDWRRRVAALYASVREIEQPKLAWQLWRQTRDELFRAHPQSPLEPAQRERFKGLPLFDYDATLRFLARLEPVAEPSEHRWSGSKDGMVHMHGFARTDGLDRRLGGELTLYWIGGYGGGVFLPFRDATSGRETYGGGRYLLDAIKSADLGQAPDGRVILDFNFAYHPSCAYSDRWVCPLSPQENTLPVAVRAGERMMG